MSQKTTCLFSQYLPLQTGFLVTPVQLTILYTFDSGHAHKIPAI